MTEEKIIFSIPFSEEEIQDFAEMHHARRLTEAEVDHIREYWTDAEDIGFIRHDIIKDLVKNAMENPAKS